MAKEKYGAKLEFVEGWGGGPKKTSVEEGGMDIFWNHTMSYFNCLFTYSKKSNSFLSFHKLLAEAGFNAEYY